MSKIDEKYQPPKEYEPKNKNFVPKTKPSSVVIIIIGGIISVALIAAAIWGAIFGISKLVEHIQNSNKNGEKKDDNKNNSALVIIERA